MVLVQYVVILGVGSSNHQSQIAYSRPRAMLPVLGKPLILRVIELFYRAGIRHYIVVVGEDEGSVASYLNARLPDAQIEFAFQSSSVSLTQTLSTIAQQLGQSFIIANYNTFVHPHFPERLLKHPNDWKDSLILSGTPLTLSSASSRYIGFTDGQRVIRIEQKSPSGQYNTTHLANLALCGGEFIEHLASLTSDTRIFTSQFLDIVSLYLETGKSAFLAESAWTLPVETDHDLLMLNRFFLNALQDCHILSDMPNNVQIIPPVRIDPLVSIGQGAKIGPRVYLEAGCSIGQYATVSDALVLQNAIVPARQRVADAIISSRTGKSRRSSTSAF